MDALLAGLTRSLRCLPDTSPPAAHAFVAVLLCLSVVGCSSTAARPVATSWADFTASYCAAWEALFRAVGNPDIGSASELSRSLDAAVKARDAASADRAAEAMLRELRYGREQIATAAGYPKWSPLTRQVDRFFAAYETMVRAKQAAARGDPAADPQRAFEQAGGIEAWQAMGEAGRSIQRTADEPDHHCATVPVGV